MLSPAECGNEEGPLEISDEINVSKFFHEDRTLPRALANQDGRSMKGENDIHISLRYLSV